MKRFFINFVLVVLFASIAAGTCHNLDTTTAFQDVVRRWLAKENGTTLREFAILSARWRDPNYLSTNPCITFTVKKNVNLTAMFGEETPSIEQAAEMLKETMNKEL